MKAVLAALCRQSAVQPRTGTADLMANADDRLGQITFSFGLGEGMNVSLAADAGQSRRSAILVSAYTRPTNKKKPFVVPRRPVLGPATTNGLLNTRIADWRCRRNPTNVRISGVCGT
ncbi:MAG: hypothetical protein KIT77_03175 [Caldilinea sp.]|nr:hypothetical protein [Caldilinea sp.]